MNKPLLATENDLDSCYLIIDECSKWLTEQGMTHWQSYYNKEKVQAKMQSTDFDVYLLKDDTGTPVATITLGIKPPEYYIVNDEKVDHLAKFENPSANAIYITALGVRPKFQGNGYAKMLVKFAEEAATTRSIPYIRFDARGDYEKLIEFYKKLGYSVVGEMPDIDSHYYLFEKKLI